MQAKRLRLTYSPDNYGSSKLMVNLVVFAFKFEIYVYMFCHFLIFNFVIYGKVAFIFVLIKEKSNKSWTLRQACGTSGLQKLST